MRKKAKTIEVSEISRIKIAPGEVLLVRFPQDISFSALETSKKILKKCFPDNSVLMYKGEVEFAVIEHTEKAK